ncbi:uncharacterized protein LOC110462645 [Mizuhopecten yessoensis]|uniref:DUF1330 domain-containing protein n=1 Tax=Mizuhopecten yessoensis TaxID=6573 RepID=A0A210PXV7_MIZYE|nr:uncharacterized protein LOC110462645 [Mizuhopecten yessoensis]XP_021372385.1 uncharacterized protein LOC110462645 [Mizuhopecten yessoensis]OWF41317.1 hypothetical protein KP79_PYT14367 [Mizuhopecten yessoensis]
MSCQQQQQTQQKAGVPLYNQASGEMYMLIRFRCDMDQRMRNAFMQEKRIMEQYNGKLMGVANSIQVVECCDKYPTDVGFALLKFRSERDADHWLISDPIFKQQDWPNPADTLEIAMFPLSYIPQENGYTTFHLTEICDVCDRNFQDNYVNKVAPIMDKFKIRHGLIATTGARDMRRTWINRTAFVLINAYESMEQFQQFYDSVHYAELKKYRQEHSNTTSVLFKLT